MEKKITPSMVPVKHMRALLKGPMPWSGKFYREAFLNACARSGLTAVTCVEDKEGRLWRVEGSGRTVQSDSVYVKVLKEMNRDCEREYGSEDLVMALGRSYGYRGNVFMKMLREGMVERTGRGLYVITDHGKKIANETIDDDTSTYGSRPLGRPSSKELRQSTLDKLNMASIPVKSHFGVLRGDGFEVRFRLHDGALVVCVTGKKDVVSKVKEVLG